VPDRTEDIAENAVAIQKTTNLGCVPDDEGVRPYDLAAVVDPGCGGISAAWNIDIREATGFIDKAMSSEGVCVIPDNLPAVVDSICNC
jgi:hypothetical protein